MKVGLLKTIAWISGAFSDAGTPSSSRVLTLLHSIAAMFALIFTTVKTGHPPDATVCGGLSAFATVHYFVNKGGSAIEAFSKKKDGE